MKKKIILGVLAVLMIFTIVGCTTEKQTLAESKWSLEIVGADKITLTDLECKELDLVELTADLKKKDGSVIPQKWSGYKLVDIINLIGVSEYTSIVVEADDGYSAEYTPDIVNDPETILGIVRDGEEREKPMMVAKNQRGNFWIKNTSKLTINK